jgi:hypothetical protein
LDGVSVLLALYLIANSFACLVFCTSLAFGGFQARSFGDRMYVTLVWPWTYFTIAFSWDYFMQTIPVFPQNSRMLPWLPLSIWIVYHTWLQRRRGAIRLWQYHAHQHIALGRIQDLCHDKQRYWKAGLYRCYQSYTLGSPYILKMALSVFRFQSTILPFLSISIYPSLIFLSYVILRFYISIHCFQNEFLVWKHPKERVKAVLVWKSEKNGWRVGLLT